MFAHNFTGRIGFLIMKKVELYQTLPSVIIDTFTLTNYGADKNNILRGYSICYCIIYLLQMHQKEEINNRDFEIISNDRDVGITGVNS